MSYPEYLLIYLTSTLTLIIMILSYNKLIKSKLEFNKKSIIVFILGGLVITYNIYNSSPKFKLAISFLVILVSAILTSKESVLKIFLNIVICYLVMSFCEILTSSVVLLTKIVDMETFDSSVILKSIVSFIILALVYYICSRKLIINFANKITNKIKDNKLITIVLLLSIIVLVISDIKYFESFSSEVYISNIVILVCILIIVLFTIFNHLKTYKEIQKTESLLGFMSKYEKIIDEDRINRHELLNDLLALKSIKNKNTKEYNKLLDSLIDRNTNKGIKIKNIYNLPSGLKGIFYYKIYRLEEEGFDININVSKNATKDLERINSKDYMDLYKIVGITLDNAIEAAKNTKNKYILVDIYSEENSIIIEISNSFKGKLDLDRINDKYYSSKGINRGFGLYIIRNMINNNDRIKYLQSINNQIFNTKIVVNKK